MPLISATSSSNPPPPAAASGAAICPVLGANAATDSAAIAPSARPPESTGSPCATLNAITSKPAPGQQFHEQDSSVAPTDCAASRGGGARSTSTSILRQSKPLPRAPAASPDRAIQPVLPPAMPRSPRCEPGSEHRQPQPIAPSALPKVAHAHAFTPGKDGESNRQESEKEGRASGACSGWSG